MPHLALVNAPVLEPVFRGLPLSVRRIERLCEQSGLPANLHENLSGLIPLHATEKFLFTLQNMVGDATFLFQSLDTENRTVRDTVANIPIPRGATGLEAFQAFAATADRMLSGARVLARISGETVWLLRTIASTEWTDNWPVHQYNLSILQSGVQRLYVSAPRPVGLMLSHRPRTTDLPDAFRDLPITQGSDAIGLGYSLRDIAMTRVRPPVGPEHQPSYKVTNLDPQASRDDIQGCLAKYVGSTATGRLQSRVAQSFGMSARSYRRHLDQMGTSHSDLLAHARLQSAMRMLDDPDMTMTQIAMELGYDYPGDFSRFFCKRTGMPPTEYRKLRAV